MGAARLGRQGEGVFFIMEGSGNWGLPDWAVRVRASSLLWRGQETVGAARLGRQGEGFFFIMEGSGNSGGCPTGPSG